MPVAFLLHFDDLSHQDYDRVMERIGVQDRTSEGVLYHFAGSSKNEWWVLDVWESSQAERADRSYSEGLPGVLREMGLPQPSRVEKIDIHNILTAQGRGI